jgi:hypothetical protein
MTKIKIKFQKLLNMFIRYYKNKTNIIKLSHNLYSELFKNMD